MSNKYKKYDKWFNRLAGLLFFGAGIHSVITKYYSDCTIVILSSYALAYWWRKQDV
ncbi:hypothetical protein N2W52_001970 [Clostridium perfringens]|nr:hypothetical protein [Clostridium perfringens]MDK0982987.1 hypothetical protein [Clostridium perfringens]